MAPEEVEQPRARVSHVGDERVHPHVLREVALEPRGRLVHEPHPRLLAVHVGVLPGADMERERGERPRERELLRREGLLSALGERVEAQEGAREVARRLHGAARLREERAEQRLRDGAGEERERRLASRRPHEELDAVSGGVYRLQVPVPEPRGDDDVVPRGQHRACAPLELVSELALEAVHELRLAVRVPERLARGGGLQVARAGEPG